MDVIEHRYSVFLHANLNTLLRANRVHDVLIASATNVCVETKPRDALARNLSPMCQAKVGNAARMNEDSK